MDGLIDRWNAKKVISMDFRSIFVVGILLFLCAAAYAADDVNAFEADSMPSELTLQTHDLTMNDLPPEPMVVDKTPPATPVPTIFPENSKVDVALVTWSVIAVFALIVISVVLLKKKTPEKKAKK
jgi:hypothetical protein